jgi:hypothetical protein
MEIALHLIFFVLNLRQVV